MFNRLNEGKSKLTSSGYPLTCPKCKAELSETESFSLTNSDGRCRNEERFVCVCGYSLILVEEYDTMYRERTTEL